MSDVAHPGSEVHEDPAAMHSLREVMDVLTAAWQRA